MHGAFAWVFALAIAGQVDTTDPTSLSTEVKRLAKVLDTGKEEADREQAEKDLIALGPDALKSLPRVGPRDSAELKNRLQRVREALETAAAAKFFAPVPVTLNGSMKLSEAAAEIAKQTNNKLVDFRPRFGQDETDPTIDLTLENATFWEAVDELFDAAKLDPYTVNDEVEGLAYMERAPNGTNRSGVGKYAGLFRFEATTVETTRDLKQPANDSLRVMVSAAWEPRIHPIVIEAPLSAMSAVDEEGAPIALDETQGGLEVGVERTQQGTDMTFYFRLPDRKVRQIAKYKCAMTALVPGEQEVFTFEKLVKVRDVKQERGDVTVVLEQTRKNNEVFEVRLDVAYAQVSTALDSHRGWIYENPAYLVGPDGKEIENAGVEASMHETGVTLSIKFDLEENDIDPAKCKFVYKTPATLVRLPIELELTGIPLP